ncbi:hypothetical protein IWX90DRAFT_419080 [Phyllosticta citrichinensis]|uniref:F-box domain-containing protein n=1 Tax=Phyllosticta citrichinensis TaxID=1130410 RepID=A0ABR1XG79_9PEZI
MDGRNRLDNDLPVEMYQLIAKFLPVEDLRSMRLVNHTADGNLEYELSLRISPFRAIGNTSSQGLQEFVVENGGRYENRITTLLIDEEEVRASLDLASATNPGADQLVEGGLSAIFRRLKNLRTIIWKVSRRKEEIIVPGFLPFLAQLEDRPLRVFAAALQGFRLKIHIAGRQFDFTVYWEGSKAQTNKIRLIGSGPSGRSRLAPITEHRKDFLIVACNNVMDHFCFAADAVHLSCVNFDGLTEEMVNEWFYLGLEVYMNFPETLVIDNCILSEHIPWENLLSYKTKLTIKNSHISIDTLDHILELAADEDQTEELEGLWIQDLHNMYFHWWDGVIDAGARLQHYIATDGLRQAAFHMRQAAREWFPDDEHGDRYRHEQPLRRPWTIGDPRQRQLKYQTQDQNFRAHHRR